MSIWVCPTCQNHNSADTFHCLKCDTQRPMIVPMTVGPSRNNRYDPKEGIYIVEDNDPRLD